MQPVKTFGEALRITRMQYGHSHTKLAKLVGVQPTVIRGWENDVGQPTGRDLPRLKGVMPGIKPFMNLIKRSGDQGTAEPLELVVDADDFVDASTAPTMEKLTSFGGYLRQARLAEGLEPSELATLLPATSAVEVEAWEMDVGVPAPKVYGQLLDLLPALRETNGVLPKAEPPKPKVLSLPSIPPQLLPPKAAPIVGTDAPGKPASAIPEAEIVVSQKLQLLRSLVRQQRQAEAQMVALKEKIKDAQRTYDKAIDAVSVAEKDLIQAVWNASKMEVE